MRTYRKYKLNKNFFKIIDTEEKAYWLGFIMADGCVKLREDRSNSGTLVINLSKKDERHLVKFRKTIKSNQPFYYKEKTRTKFKNHIINSSEQIRLSLNSIELVNDLIKLGCIPKKSLVLKFPTFEQVPKYLIHHFIRGYFDGDGCITFSKKKKNSYIFKLLGTFEFLNSIKEILSENHCNNNKIKKCNKIYALDYGGNNQVYKIYQFLYKGATIFLKRKNRKFKDMIKNGLTNIDLNYNPKNRIFKFWDDNGNIIEGASFTEICGKYPHLNPSSLGKVYIGTERQTKGWTKYVEGAYWSPVKFAHAPTTGNNYNYSKFLDEPIQTK